MTFRGFNREEDCMYTGFIEREGGSETGLAILEGLAGRFMMAALKTNLADEQWASFSLA